MSLNATNKHSTLVIGLGNPLRTDDGVGSYVAESIEAKGLNHVKVWVTQQLHVEDLEPMLNFAKVILVDASTTGPGVDLREVETTTQENLASSHHLSAQMFVKLAQRIYHKKLNMMVCSIRGSNFDMGDRISPQIQYCASKAIELICSEIKDKKYA